MGFVNHVAVVLLYWLTHGLPEMLWVSAFYAASRLKAVSEPIYALQQKVDQVEVENTAIIIEIMGHIHSDDDYLEEVIGELQRIQLGGFLLLCAHLEG